MPTSPLAQQLTDRLAGLSALDAPAQAYAKQVRSLLKPGALKDALSGTWQGHPLHPVLTDVVIGSWTSATLLDLIGGPDARAGAERLVAVGILSALPTALSGTSDWADSEPADDAVRRVGAVHAVGNVAALALYTASLIARRKDEHGRGVALGLAASAIMSASGFLGGHLSFAEGVGVDQTTFDSIPEDWTPAIDESQLAESRLTQATVDGVDLVLVRRDGRIHALADRCSHRGGSLADGELVEGCVQCPLHGSRFDLEDGSVRRGPAAYAQPAYETRVRDGRVEVREVA